MKEIIKKIIVGILAVGIVVGAAVYRFVIYPKNKAETTTTAAVSDTTAEAETTTKKQKAEKTTAESTTVESTSAEQVSEAETEAQNEEPSSSAPAQTQTPANDSQPATTKPTTTKPATTKTETSEEEIIDDSVAEGNLIDPYQQVFKSGKFLMKVSDPDLGPVTMAMNGNKMFIEASMEGLSLKMVYNGDVKSKDNPDQGTWYIVIDSLKMYSPMPGDMVGDMNVEELTKDFANEDDNTVYTQSVEEITLNGEKTLVNVESCVDSNGNTTKYYFDGDVLIRSDSIGPDGSVSTTEFAEISADVPDSLFTFPSNYKERDISWLFNAIGG